VVVGAFEEIVFRGFAMTELAAGGLNPFLQVIAGALLWSLGHFRLGSPSGGV
jgi:membrane protease YdiL (CAAX protease family)